MLVGVPKELKADERRVGLTPHSVKTLVSSGHSVLVESGAGLGIGMDDHAYRTAGATVVGTADDVFAEAVLIVKVKEPLPDERQRLKRNQILFAYLHLAPDHQQTTDLLASGAVCIAFETATEHAGGLPLLRPMSQVAGRLAIQAGAHALESYNGGKGLLLGGVPGVRPGTVLILGGGVVGFHATQMAVGTQADVVVMDKNLAVLDQFSRQFGSRVKTAMATEQHLVDLLPSVDLVVGGVLIKGAETPKLITKPMLSSMQTGSVLVDVAIDQGGCFETSRPTTHRKPTFDVDGIVHYCVTNMPGCVAHTSTEALNNAILPHVLSIADKGWVRAMADDPHLLNGLNIWNGTLCCRPVGEAQNRQWISPDTALNALE